MIITIMTYDILTYYYSHDETNDVIIRYAQILFHFHSVLTYSFGGLEHGRMDEIGEHGIKPNM